LLGENVMENKQEVIQIRGMDCASCALTIEKNLSELAGVKEASVSFGTGEAAVTYDEKTVSLDVLKNTIKTLGYKISEQQEEVSVEGHELELLRLGLVGLAILITWSGIWRIVFSFNYVALLTIILGGFPIYKLAYSSLRAKSVTVEIAMTIGIIASFAIGEFLAAMVIVFFTLFAEFLEDFTLDKGRAAIRELLKISPEKAVVKRDGEEIEVNVSEVKPGDIVLVKPGEKIPVDGTIVIGNATVNQAPITGESMPAEKGVGDEVFAGTIDEAGVLEVKTTRVGKDTTLGRIIELVEKAESAKAPVQKFADHFAARFVPVVLGIAFVTFLITRNITSTIAVIVVACPCAVALATPLAVVASIGKAAKKGIIIKGGVYLEELSRVNTIVVDKTGTLTLGEPRITDVKGFEKHGEKDIVYLAAITEKHSTHPLARAITKKAEEYELKIPEHTACQIIAGKGVVCEYNNKNIFMGSREFLREKRIAIPERVQEYMRQKETEGKTAMLIAHDDAVCGVVCVADVLRGEVALTLNELKALGIKSQIMLTGDNPRTAQAIASQVGIKEVMAEMMPEEKVEKVRQLVNQGKKVLMVGDGVNDAPALETADVGVAMGTAGTAAAIEAADVALMTDDFRNVAEAIKIGRKTFGVIKQNIVSSIIFNVVGVTLAIIGILNPLMAAVAHALPDFILFINSSRLIRE
jgi:Cd2+/Zn2+-exporting ATPase/Cu+-exporting ATPase